MPFPHNESKTIGPSGAGAVAIGRFVAPIAGHALSRGGAVLTEILTGWPSIAGPALAVYTIPAKLSKGAPKPGASGKASPSLLHLKVEPARVLEVQYQVPQLIERINQSLGFEAICAIRIIQAPVCGKPIKPPVSSRHIPVATDGPAPPGRLGAALARMAAGIKTRGLYA
jgi:hypothetical protein